MKVKQIKTRKELLNICSEYKFNNVLDLLKIKYDIYDPERGSLHPLYYIFYKDTEPIGILVINSEKCHYKGYLQIIMTEISKDYIGKNITKEMIEWLSNGARHQGWKGLSLQTINPVNKKWMDEEWNYPDDIKFNDEKETGDKIVKLYKKLGFTPVSYTSWDGLNMKKELNESYNSISLGAGQNYKSSADSLYFEYKLLPLSNNLGQRGYKTFSKTELDTYPIKQGDYVSGVSPIDEKRHYGVIQRFYVPEGQTEFEWVFILDKDTSEIIAVYPDTVKIAVRTGKAVNEVLLNWNNTDLKNQKNIVNVSSKDLNPIKISEETKIQWTELNTDSYSEKTYGIGSEYQDKIEKAFTEIFETKNNLKKFINKCRRTWNKILLSQTSEDLENYGFDYWIKDAIMKVLKSKEYKWIHDEYKPILGEIWTDMFYPGIGYFPWIGVMIAENEFNDTKWTQPEGF